ncbi:hypothetical protein ATK74_2800 [Propionicimonas paludicola]|uniref:Uncharacterized protein n=1 Tax=Propionicimonas paludicola TaxID=185243 RepID=A0A2A9CVP2_9ACTN|nr:DUF6049 family protein [Propionicimonas paludicola]PFG18216.1 hypothetical protein ATK74_2800 [Propionicimonas paludicola]
MTRGGSGFWRRALGYLLAVLLAATGIAWLAPSTAEAITVPQLQVTLNSLTVSGSEPDDTVKITATVTNTSPDPVYGVQAILWRSRDPIRDPGTLRKAEAAEAGWGSRMTATPDHYRLVTRSTEAFAPGAKTQLKLKATLADLGFDTTGAAYAFGLQVLGTSDQSSSYAVAGQIRTFVSLPGAQVPVTSAVLLSTTPSKVMDGLFSNESLSAELTGRLGTLLTAAERPGHSWLIDPELLDEVRDQADGYQVITGGQTVPGAGQAIAASWLARYQQLNRNWGGRTLYGNPDVVGAAAAGNAAVLSRAEMVGDSVLGLSDLPLVVVPNGLILNQATLESLSGLEDAAVLAGNSSATQVLQPTSGGPIVVPVMNTASATAEPGSLESRLLSLATTVVAGGSGQLRLITSAADLAKDESSRPDWVDDRSLADLLASAKDGSPELIEQVGPTLSTADFDQLTQIEHDFATYEEVAPSAAVLAQSAPALARLSSSAWIQVPQARADLLRALSDRVGPHALDDGIELHASSRFVMSSRTNEFPITVTNELSDQIQVMVRIVSDNPQRLTVPPSKVFTIDPGQSQTVNIRPEASSNGVVVATAQLTSASGHRISEGTRIVVEVTDLGMVAWVIVAISAVVLVGATAFRIRQVRRRNAAAEAQVEPERAE